MLNVLRCILVFIKKLGFLPMNFFVQFASQNHPNNNGFLIRKFSFRPIQKLPKPFVILCLLFFLLGNMTFGQNAMVAYTSQTYSICPGTLVDLQFSPGDCATTSGDTYSISINGGSSYQPIVAVGNPSYVTGWNATTRIVKINTSTATGSIWVGLASCGCSPVQTLVYNISTPTTPSFTQLGPYCQNVTPGTLTTTSTNSIVGTWSPSTISTATVGSQTYTFTPTSTAAPTCATGTTMSITISSNPTISGTLTTCINATTQLTGSGTPATSNPWISSNTGVATVSSTGVVTGVGSGTTTITYTNSAGCSVTATITVSDIIDWVNLQFPGSGSICQGGSYTIYGQLYNNTGTVNTEGAGVAATGVTAEFGYSTSNSNPSTWTNWSTATFNPAGGGTQNDEYMGTLTGLSPGTYYYTFRY